ncbi:P-loop containing nucleoside triphosphate hydrolase protein, partial [Mycena leptocephala]
MPRQPTPTENRLNNISTYLNPAIILLREINDAFHNPFIQPIINTTLALITAVQNVKRNKDECVRLTENIHRVLYAIVNLHIRSETAGSLPPSVLDRIGSFNGTLHKIYTFIEAQQDGNKIKQFFLQSEMNMLLKNCRAGLDHAMEVFKIGSDVTIFNSISEMKRQTETMHNELLELISTLSDGTISDRSSSIYHDGNYSQNSSNSFSMLPSKPKIFHGRESELEDIMNILDQESPRIAILGGGGMGKTSLARAVLHHPDTCTKFSHRYFVSAESTTSSIELAALIAQHLGLEVQQDLTRPVVTLFSQLPSSLLVLDNLETPWEPIQSRSGVEEFLSLLTDVPHLALIITMRGAERPARVRWTRPCLLPLKPLSDEAARQIFIDVTDNSHNIDEINQLLWFTDNMPLAVDLLAHLVDYEGLSNVLTRWETRRTNLLSAGHDRQSNLDVSIGISLSSPRITSGGRELLSLLSILPDGLSDAELIQSNLPIQNILRCKATLLGTSLAYQDDRKRLRSLVPIREYIQQYFPPSQILIQSIGKYFHLILDLYQKYNG